MKLTKKRFKADLFRLAELGLSIIVAACGEQHGIPGLVVVGFALMGISGCRIWANR